MTPEACPAVVGYAAAAACSDMAVANTLVPAYTGTLMLFAGTSSFDPDHDFDRDSDRDCNRDRAP